MNDLSQTSLGGAKQRKEAILALLAHHAPRPRYAAASEKYDDSVEKVARIIALMEGFPEETFQHFWKYPDEGRSALSSHTHMRLHHITTIAENVIDNLSSQSNSSSFSEVDFNSDVSEVIASLEDDNESLHAKIEALEEEIAEWDDALAEANETISRQEDEIEGLQEENHDLTSSLAEADDQVAALEADLDEKDDYVVFLENELEKFVPDEDEDADGEVSENEEETSGDDDKYGNHHRAEMNSVKETLCEVVDKFYYFFRNHK